MTPGYAKRRDELPWLPYRTSDKVIINSHNFGGGAFSPAVNGKMPVAAWIPSRDTAGNGTTTLTDLAGGNNGTLTNMDPATDWVADTSAGGVRALDFDGTNDFVVSPDSNDFTQPGGFSISMWVKPQNISKVQNPFIDKYQPSNQEWVFGINTIRLMFWVFDQTTGGLRGRFVASVSTFMSTGVWSHVVAVYDGGTTTSSCKIFIDGVQRDSTDFTSGAFTAIRNTASTVGIARTNGGLGGPFAGRKDDMRFFDLAVDTTDIAALYASGLGRGIDAS